MAKTDLTAERVRELFDYCPTTGLLTARITGNKRYAGTVAGTPHVNRCGHKTLVVTVDGGTYLAHRVIWLHTQGEWPKHTIDHINGDSRDNRIENLRDVPQAINQKNLKKSNTNTSGVTGVSWRESKHKWRAYITVQRECIHLGYFDNLLDAISSRNAALVKFGFSLRHGL